MSLEVEKLILENHDDIASDDDEGAPILQPITKEELRAIRAERRAQKAAEIHAKAEVFRRMGDELYEKEKYEEALIPYLEATQIWPSNVEYYILLSAAYTKLKWFEEAAHAATRALTLDPKSIEARYTRALARLEQRLLTAAKIDLEIVVEHEPTHEKAKTSLDELKATLDAAAKPGSEGNTAEAALPTLQDLDFSYPQYDDSPLDVDEVSNSSDCNHRGNGVPCRYYNRGRCGKGIACPYSHAPDEKSVRDDLGHNVCIYFLLDNCRYGETKCVYSHSKEFLPNRGWWSDPEQTEKIKAIVELTEKTAKEQRSLAQVFKRQSKASALSKLKSRGKAYKTPKTPKTTQEKAEGEGKDGNEEEKGGESGDKKPEKSRPRSKKYHRYPGHRKPKSNATTGGPVTATPSSSSVGEQTSPTTAHPEQSTPVPAVGA